MTNCSFPTAQSPNQTPTSTINSRLSTSPAIPEHPPLNTRLTDRLPIFRCQPLCLAIAFSGSLPVATYVAVYRSLSSATSSGRRSHSQTQQEPTAQCFVQRPLGLTTKPSVSLHSSLPFSLFGSPRLRELSLIRNPPAPAGKATNENLTSEDWGAIIEVCDKVASDTNGPKEVVQSLIRRLAHRNANVQLYTLEVRFFPPR